MKLEMGSKEKVTDFVENISNKDKVALISHNDLDGITAAKVMTKVISPKEIFLVDYPELNQDLAEKLKKTGFNKVVFTDLYIKDRRLIQNLEEFAQVLIIDHHRSEDLNSKKTVFVKGDGYSSGYMCYWLFSDTKKGKDVEKLDWLVACSCISDYLHVKPKNWLSKTMKKYGDDTKNWEIYAKKTGKFWDLQYKLSLAIIHFKDKKEFFYLLKEDFGDIDIFEKYVEEIQKEIGGLVEGFEKRREEFEGGYFFEINPKFGVKSIVSNIISGLNPKKTIVLIKPKSDIYMIGVRRQDGKVDCDELLKGLLKGFDNASGGGHIPAAGGHFLKKDLSEVRKRLGLTDKKI